MRRVTVNFISVNENLPWGITFRVAVNSVSRVLLQSVDDTEGRNKNENVNV